MYGKNIGQIATDRNGRKGKIVAARQEPNGMGVYTLEDESGKFTEWAIWTTIVYVDLTPSEVYEELEYQRAGI